MCKLMDDIVREENEKVLKELEEERQKTIKRIAKMIAKGYFKEEILDLDYTEEEYKEAEKELFTTV